RLIALSIYSLSISHAVKCKFILSNRFALSTAKAIEPLPKWVSKILKLGFEYSLIKNSYNCIGFSVGCILSCLSFIFCCSIPFQRHLNFLTAVSNEAQASSQSAKFPVLSLSHTIQQLLL